MSWVRALVACLLAVAPFALSAQISGIVRDEAGRPAEGAVVDLWVATARVGRVVTTVSGRFDFPGVSGGGRVVVRRIGSRPVQRDVLSGGPELTIQLASAPPVMEPLTVDGGCGRGESKAARSLWERAARSYQELPDSLWLSAEFKLTVERVARDEVGRPVIDSTGYGWIGYAPRARKAGEAAVAQGGYPAPDPERSELLTDGIVHAELQHFVSPSFGARVRFQEVEPGRIRFCPKGTKAPWISGEMILAEDGSLLWAWWRYGARQEIPSTGGVATFAAPSPAHDLPLLPTSYLNWQERPSGMAAQRSFEYREWRVTKEKPEWGR